MGETASNRSQQIINHHLQACLVDLLQAGIAHPDAAVHVQQGWTILLAVFPSAPEADSTPQLSECDRHCLILLARQQQPLSGCKVCKELDRQGIGVWGLATVKRSLARLKHLGLVGSSRRRPRGYFLPENRSLFLRTLPLDTENDTERLFP